MDIVFCKNSFIGELFSNSGLMGMIFRKCARFMGILFRNSPDLWAVLVRFEWHNPASWKVKLPPPPRFFLIIVTAFHKINIGQGHDDFPKLSYKNLPNT